MIAAHVLDYDPHEEPVMMTEHTAEQLTECTPVLQGAECDKQVDMFTGFKQIDDKVGNIYPDNTVRRHAELCLCGMRLHKSEPGLYD